ncbi:hypothetical protein QQS21_001543 [Conoideocrella luteorostrata]|uniref:Peptidase C15, pyroglutamyl peptidase I-like protein n=1 Tax=Conoideocrella luteorostrata TaxID=1105319 RepID=A0AAJ0CZF7_9HYPO|nr:hypothetical protein QQS21_001543 [Conoideocrella luteorostrata]
MGSQINDPQELVVLVTGFLVITSSAQSYTGNTRNPYMTQSSARIILLTTRQPFRPQWPVNPSWEIAKDLPPYLPPLQAKYPNARGTVELPPVRILVHPEPLRVNYKFIRDIVPSFWDTYQGYNVDAVIHIGMTGPRTFYQIERRAHRRGYRIVDVDLQLPEEGTYGKPEDPDWIWHDQPDEIISDLDIDDVHKRWQAHSSKDIDLRISENPGRFLCDWIYYCSLSHLLKASRPKKVCFFHVPCDASERSVSQGRELALNMIRAIAESEVLLKQKKSEQNGTET